MSTINLLLALVLISAAPAYAANSSAAAKFVQQGGGGVALGNAVSDPNPHNCITMSAIIALEAAPNCVADDFYPLYSSGLMYQVPAGSTFWVEEVCATSGTAGAQVLQLVSSTATIAEISTSLSGSPGYQNGRKGAANNAYGYPVATANVPYCQATPYSFASASYPGIQCGSGNTLKTTVTGRTCTP